MKSILSITFLAIFALAMMSGCATSGQQASRQPAAQCVVREGKLLDMAGKPMTGCVMMHHGKMMVMHGKLTPIKRNMTMPDGTVCMVDGTCVMKGGKKMKLAEGEVISPSGNIFQAKGLSVPGSHY